MSPLWAVGLCPTETEPPAQVQSQTSRDFASAFWAVPLLLEGAPMHQPKLLISRRKAAAQAHGGEVSSE